MFIDCEVCRGKGRIVEEGFDGRTGRACPGCRGTGEVALTPEETAIMERFLADCAASLAGAATVADVERFVNASTRSWPEHPGMTARFFDASVKKAFDRGLSISPTTTPGVVAVSSGGDADASYDVTATTCTCIAGERLGRCYHRAYYLWWRWVTECEGTQRVIAAERAAVAA